MSESLRNKVQKFYLNEEELRIVENSMKKMNMTNKSDYFREMVLKGKKVVIEHDKNLDKINVEINKIGTNINQIAKITNERRNIYHEDIRELQECLTAIRRIIDNEFKKLTVESKKINEVSIVNLLGDEIFDKKK